MENETVNESKRSSFDDSVERRLLRFYYKRLTEIGVDTVERGTKLQHAKWMCLHAQSFDDIQKMNRWLGWIQAWLVAETIYGLDDIIYQTREEMERYEHENQNHR